MGIRFWWKDLYKANHAKNKQIVNKATDVMVDSRNAPFRKETPCNDNPDRIVSIQEKVLNFNK